MDEIEVVSLDTLELEDPVFIEGLPGVGFVGKLVVDHLLEELENTPIKRIYSEHFPPAVSVDETGTATLTALSINVVQTGDRDLVLLSGDSQAQGTIGQYRLANKLLDIVESLDITELITLGGFGTGGQIEDYYVVGAVSEGNDGLKTKLSDAGVSFEGDEVPGNIVGMSGVLLGLGGNRGLQTASLLGITPGYYVDPMSARVVLEVLSELYGFTVSFDSLDEQADEIQSLLEQLQETHPQEQSQSQSDENLRYFG